MSRNQPWRHQKCNHCQNITSTLVSAIVFAINVTFSLFYLFDWNFADLMSFFLFLQGTENDLVHNLAPPVFRRRSLLDCSWKWCFFEFNYVIIGKICNNFKNFLNDSFCNTIFTKKYSKRKRQFSKHAISLVKQLFLTTKETKSLHITFIIFFLGYHKYRHSILPKKRLIDRLINQP